MDHDIFMDEAGGDEAQLSDLDEAPILSDQQTLFPSVEENDEDDDAWRQQLEDVKRRYRQQQEEGKEVGALARNKASLGGDELAALIRAAIRGASWAEVTFPAIPPKDHAVVEAIRCLHDHEVLELVRVCASRYETHMRERSMCSIWVTHVLELRSSSLVGKPQLRGVLKPLFRKLNTRVGKVPRASLTSCIGKWKLARAMVAARRRVALADESTSVGEDGQEGDADQGSEGEGED